MINSDCKFETTEKTENVVFVYEKFREIRVCCQKISCMVSEKIVYVSEKIVYELLIIVILSSKNKWPKTTFYVVLVPGTCTCTRTMR